ncbi:hypothetical protein C8J57DRAFT_1512045 [Mycena rebaudengoi]|nr:hypothetical protein C8J57DRAFT_1512045 [Mycena rebaudengoi]
MNSGDAYGYKVRHLPSSTGTDHVLCSILLKTIKDKSLYLAASDGCKSNGAQVANAPSAAYFRARRKSAGDELVRRARGTSVWAPNIHAPKTVGPSLTSRLSLSCQRIILPTRAPAMESMCNLTVNPSGTQSLHHDVAEDPSFLFLCTDFDSNDFSNVPPSRETSSQSPVSTKSYPPNHDYTSAHVPPSPETSLPSQSLVSPNSYPPNHDHTSTHVPPSPETSLPSQSLVSINSYVPTHDHPSHPNNSAPTPNGQLQTGTVTPRQNAMYLDVPPAVTHDPGESNEAAVIIAPRRYLLWLREMLQRQPQFQFFLSTLSQFSDCSAAPDTHYADTNLPSSAPSAHCEAEHAVRSVTTEYDTGPTQSTNGAFGSGVSLHYAAGLADAAETVPPDDSPPVFPELVRIASHDRLS